jgi:NAD(P)-dependent dehydrogenase (short-subunit alcohol dehydrogenase family)
VAQSCAHFRRVDILVNNAGMSPLYSSLEEVSEELWDKCQLRDGVLLNQREERRCGRADSARSSSASACTPATASRSSSAPRARVPTRSLKSSSVHGQQHGEGGALAGATGVIVPVGTAVYGVPGDLGRSRCLRPRRARVRQPNVGEHERLTVQAKRTCSVQ